ncbi:MAG: DUF6495 family protein [Bacteroidota bacterium]
MRYRCLTDQELQSLETEFKHFLVSHGLYAKEWRELNEQAPDKAQELVEIFSDVVFGKVVEKAEYLLHRSPQDLKLFHFEDAQIQMLGLKLQAAEINLTEDPYQADLGRAIHDAGAERIKLLRGKKAYQKSREEEIFALLEQGCEITDHQLFDRLASLL